MRRAREIRDPVNRVRHALEPVGEDLINRCTIEPGGGLAAHLHPRQTETWSVLEGSVRFRFGDAERTIGPGDGEIIVAPNTAHALADVGDREAHLRCLIVPALRLQAFLEEAADAANEGLFTVGGRPVDCAARAGSRASSNATATRPTFSPRRRSCSARSSPCSPAMPDPTMTLCPPGHEPARARRARRLSARTRRSVLTAHIVVSVGLLGEVSAFLAIAARAASSDDPAFAATACDLLAMCQLLFGIPLSFVALSTGLTLGLGSKWGVLRYPWVTIKLGLIVSVILMGALVLGPLLTLSATGKATWRGASSPAPPGTSPRRSPPASLSTSPDGPRGTRRTTR